MSPSNLLLLSPLSHLVALSDTQFLELGGVGRTDSLFYLQQRSKHVALYFGEPSTYSLQPVVPTERTNRPVLPPPANAPTRQSHIFLKLFPRRSREMRPPHPSGVSSALLLVVSIGARSIGPLQRCRDLGGCQAQSSLEHTQSSFAFLFQGNLRQPVDSSIAEELSFPPVSCVSLALAFSRAMRALHCKQLLIPETALFKNEGLCTRCFKLLNLCRIRAS